MTGDIPPAPPVSIRDRLRSFTPFRRKSQPDKLHPAPVPAEKRVVYAVGDIHGRYDLLIELEDRISRDLAERGSPPSLLVFLGDYVDRGPESREVLTHLAAGASPCDQHVFLRGNHEQVMIDLLGSADMLDAWAKFGGIETLVSYGLRPRLPLSPEGREHLRRELLRVLPPSHKSFLIATRYSHETDDFFFAHAGVNPAFDLEHQHPEELMWIREPFLSSRKNFGKRIVHGHTPVTLPDIRVNRINVDTKAFATGRLSTAVIAGDTCTFLSTVD